MTNKTKIQDDETKRMFMQLMEDDAYVDISEDVKYPPVAISCGTYNDVNHNGDVVEYHIPIGTYGNFSFIQAPPKSMKSFFSSLLVSAYQSDGNKYSGLLKGHRKGRKIIHFDTAAAPEPNIVIQPL